MFIRSLYDTAHRLTSYSFLQYFISCVDKRHPRGRGTETSTTSPFDNRTIEEKQTYKCKRQLYYKIDLCKWLFYDIGNCLTSYSFVCGIVVELFSVTRMCSNIAPCNPTQRQVGDNDTHDDSSGSSDSVALSQHAEDRHSMMSGITETALFPLSQITEITEVDNIGPHTSRTKSDMPKHPNT